MEINPIPPVQESRTKEEPATKLAVSADENPTVEAAPTDTRVEASLGTADVQEEARRMAELLKEAMRELDYTIQFEPQEEAGQIVIRVIDDQGKVVRVIPQDKFEAIRSELAVGGQSGLLFNGK